MRIFCPVWGNKHINLLKNALGKSLSWPRNAKAITGCEWNIITSSQQEASQIANIIQGFGIDSQAQIIVIPQLDNPNTDKGMILIVPLRETIQACLKDKKPMLMATPDFIYGDGTIDAFKAIAKEEGSCASIAHLRVIPSIFESLKDLEKRRGTPSNAQLMGKAFIHSHISWSDSDHRLYKSGLRKWKVSEDKIAFESYPTYAVQHFMPSPFFCNFLSQDLDSFNKWVDGRPPGFGLFDHWWPTDLIEQGRLKFIGSSDIACMVEITDVNANVPPINELNDPPNGFMHTKLHNNIQKQFISCFRGEL